MRKTGLFGLIATNTIAQGDTREVGLDQLTARGFTIPRAIQSQKWPGVANLEVAHVWAKQGSWAGSYWIGNSVVEGITSYLTAVSASTGKPHRLFSNLEKSFIGTYVLGMGFVLEPDEAQALIEQSPRNGEVIFPFLNGDDVNTRPDHSPSRWVINFFDWPLERAHEYSDCIAIIQEKVRPERQRKNEKGEYALRKPLPERWWQYADRRPALYSTIASTKRLLVIPLVSKFMNVVWMSTGIVYSHAVGVIALEADRDFAIIQSAFHEEWARVQGSTLETRMRYTPSDCFETFPFPACLLEEPLTQSRRAAEPQSEQKSSAPSRLRAFALKTDPSAPSRLRAFALRQQLDAIGEAYHEHRRQIMLARQEGLTKTYNRFHSVDEASEDVAELRRLHVEMDNAVAATYGWGDLDLGHGFHTTKQGLRYTISEAARRTVLDRLLALNHQRYAEEVAAGLHDRGSSRKGAKTQRRGGKKKVEGQGELF